MHSGVHRPRTYRGQTTRPNMHIIKTKETPKEGNTQTTGVTEESLTNAMIKAHNATKNDKNKPITINNNLEPMNPNDYLSLKI